MTSEGRVETAGGVYRYSFGPFQLASEIELPELEGIPAAGERQARISVGGVPRALDRAERMGDRLELTPREFLLGVPGVGRFYVADGQTVRVEPDAAVEAADVRAYLLGSVFGALCHQSGLLPLHASAVEHGGAVTAFLGDSGAGKSTLAACLRQRGHAVISDDICLLETDADGVRVIPVAGWLKLWRRSFEHLGQEPEARNRTYSLDDKYRLYLDGAGGGRGVPRNVVFLAKATGVEPVLEGVSVPTAIAELMRLTYLPYVVEYTGAHARVFGQCARLLRTAKAWRLKVPWDLERMDRTLELVERELLSRG